MIDTLLLATARIATFEFERGLTNASGFFFERDERLFLVTSRHVLIDEPSKHHPNRIEIELHTNAADLGQSTGLSVLLFKDGQALWHQGRDAGGEIDVAVIEIDRSALPAGTLLHAFTPAHLPAPATAPDAPGGIPVGSRLLVAGFPLGFHDTLHHLPVVRQAVLATAWGLRFQGEGFFLTDARTHRGTSGAPVVMPEPPAPAGRAATLPWKLLGVHSGRLDMSTRDKVLDESLGLNMAWYADILLTLTAAPAARAPAVGPAVPPS
jgi:hypothetical protein